MEFNFLGDDLKTPTFQFSSPIQTHFSDPSLLRGGFPRVVPVPLPNAEQILNPNVAGEDMLRKLDKERIRREIISGDIARRRMLEEEVRRELLLERELAFRRSLGEKFLLGEQVAMGLNPRPNMISSFDNRPLEERIRPETISSVEPAGPKINMDKLIVLAQPNPEIYREKRKAVTQDAAAADDDAEHSPVVVKKKVKDDWTCALCNVRVTSEKALVEHLQGKKHKIRESAQKRMQKIGTSAGPSSTSKNNEQSPKPTEPIFTTTTTSDLEAKADAQPQPEVIMGDANQTVVGKDLVEDKEMLEKIQNKEDSEKQNGTETGGVRVPNAVNKGFKFWCELCHVGSFSVAVMENHQRGRKHTNRLKKSLKNDQTAPPTSAVV